ncbi:MAG: hypothetical protein ACU83P_00105 [Gammaproteobacteria bacterium]
MPYVSRNDAGEIIGLHHAPPAVDSEWLDSDAPEISRFLQLAVSSQEAKQALTNTDADMSRVVEDLVDLLIAKKIFTFTELPEAVQRKLGSRKQLRKDMGTLFNLINKNDTIF